MASDLRECVSRVAFGRAGEPLWLWGICGGFGPLAGFLPRSASGAAWERRAVAGAGRMPVA